MAVIRNALDAYAERPELLVEKLQDKKWRLNNLYWILNKNGEEVPFHMNPVQEQFYDNLWYRNIVLKARQHGMSTLIQLFILDHAIFKEGQDCSVTADKRENAEALFTKKVVFAWEKVDPRIKEILQISAKVDRKDKIVFSNGSTIYVSVSVRSQTVQIHHISEYGKISVENPARAREIKLGSFPAAHKGNIVIIESTSEGQEGEFYELCSKAIEKGKQVAAGRAALSKLDFRLHFFPWWAEQSYRLDDRTEAIEDHLVGYFTRLERDHGIRLDAGQKAWYAVQLDTMGAQMKREYPSYADEAFEISVVGAYFREEMYRMRREGRVLDEIPLAPVAVDTWWDIGVNDTTAIIMTQMVHGYIHVVDFYESSGHGVEHYIRRLVSLGQERKLIWGKHYPPHDSAKRCFQTGKDTLSTAAQLNFHFEHPTRRPNVKIDSIEAARKMMFRVKIDRKHAGALIRHLDNYHKRWDAKNGCWENRPRKSEHNNAADAMQVLAMRYDDAMSTLKQPRRVRPRVARPW